MKRGERRKKIILQIVFGFSLLFIFFLCTNQKELKAQQEREELERKRIADSIRVADSIRIADSLFIAKYKEAEIILKEEKAKKKDIILDSLDTNEMANISCDTFRTNTDIFSTRQIVLTPDNPYFLKVDSIQKEYDRFNEYIHSDSKFREVKDSPLPERIRYMRFLLHHNIKDTSDIVDYWTKLIELYNIKKELLIALRESQSDNTKIFVQTHIKSHLKEMKELSDFLFEMAPERREMEELKIEHTNNELEIKEIEEKIVLDSLK